MSDREYPARPIVGIGIVVIKGDSVLLVPSLEDLKAPEPEKKPAAEAPKQ